jgi:3-dehydroquinate synthase
MKNNKLLIKAKSKSYPIYFGNKIINSIERLLSKNIPGVKKIFIITDKNVPSIKLNLLVKSLNRFEVKVLKISVNEKLKNLKFANQIIEDLLNKNFNRSDCIIAFGGGIIGDLSAFVASVTKRGLQFVNIPTTLLSQCDSSIGGKTGVNSKLGKNLIGTFYQPNFVLTDLSLLNSLPQKEIICGYGEILKHALILDKKFFLWLCKHGKKIINDKDSKLLKSAIIKSCKIKSNIINKDEKEKNVRMILNFGHTFAHGFEGAKNFSKTISHGEAVLMGMFLASKLSLKMKLLSKNELSIITKHYLNLKLPMKISKKFKKRDINKILLFMKKDKKNVNSKINLILLKKVGKTTKPNEILVNDNVIKNFLNKNYN